MINKKLIKINLPLTEADFTSGNGEGVWVEVGQKAKAAYDQDAIGAGYCGILANDSLYYPGLRCGEIIHFEMRGPFRPVADIQDLHTRFPYLTSEAKTALIKKIAEAENTRHCRSTSLKVSDPSKEGSIYQCSNRTTSLEK